MESVTPVLPQKEPANTQVRQAWHKPPETEACLESPWACRCPHPERRQAPGGRPSLGGSRLDQQGKDANVQPWTVTLKASGTGAGGLEPSANREARIRPHRPSRRRNRPAVGREAAREDVRLRRASSGAAGSRNRCDDADEHILISLVPLRSPRALGALIGKCLKPN